MNYSEFFLPVETFVDYMESVNTDPGVEARIKTLTGYKVSICKLNETQWMFTGMESGGAPTPYVVLNMDLYWGLEAKREQYERELSALKFKRHLLAEVIGIPTDNIDFSEDVVLEIGKDSAVLKYSSGGDVTATDVLGRWESNPQPSGPRTYGGHSQLDGFGPQHRPQPVRQPWDYSVNANHGQGFSSNLPSGYLNGKALAKSISIAHPNLHYDGIVNALQVSVGKPIDYITGAVFTDEGTYNQCRQSYPLDVAVIGGDVHLTTPSGALKERLAFK